MRNTIIAAAIALAAAAPAHAAKYESGSYDHESYAFEYTCPSGLSVSALGDADGRYRLREGRGESDGTFLLLDRTVFTETHMNTETGDFFTVVFAGTFNEVKSRRVEGSLYEFRVIESGKTVTVYDSDGNEIARDRGSVRWSFLFDSGGDDEPGGFFLDEWDFAFSGQHTIRTNDMCANADAFIG